MSRALTLPTFGNASKNRGHLRLAHDLVGLGVGEDLREVGVATLKPVLEVGSCSTRLRGPDQGCRALFRVSPLGWCEFGEAAQPQLGRVVPGLWVGHRVVMSELPTK